MKHNVTPHVEERLELQARWVKCSRCTGMRPGFDLMRAFTPLFFRSSFRTENLCVEEECTYYICTAAV